MGYDKNTVSQHLENSQPLDLVFLAGKELIEHASLVVLVFLDHLGAQYEGSRNVHQEVIVELAVVVEDDSHVDDQAEKVYHHDALPPHGADKAGVHHHGLPGDKALVQVQIFVILQDGLVCHKHPDQRNDKYMEVSLE